ncbi:hypothetical protein R3W88_024514 [Solanum pinnatisectum]|uniref:Uncharacterized protein n=1 Tax=Solanum pinnatisectum TaxID=50273 RepID=A0AAV9M0T4_9SOLN|nr:hypothetical protein R3W88_024514 [Solanum pinnatisectum]
MDGMGIYVWRLIVDQIIEFALGRDKSIIFPSLVTRLYYEVVVVKRHSDEENKS